MVNLLPKSEKPVKSKSPGVFDLPGFGCVSLRWMLFQDINAWTEGREAPGAAYSSNNYTYTRRGSLRTFNPLYRSGGREVKLADIRIRGLRPSILTRALSRAASSARFRFR